MKPMPLAPALPEPDGSPKWSLLASVVLHAVVIAVLLAVLVEPHLPNGGAPPSYDLVFEGASGGTPQSANPVQREALPPAQPADIPPPPDAVPGIPAPTPLTTPDPAATGAPPPSASSSPPPSAVPPTPAPLLPTPPVPAPARAPAPAAADSAPPPVVPAAPDQDATILQAPENPAVRLDLPPQEAAPAPPQPIMPQPPPPLPPQPEKPPTLPAPRPSPRAQLGTLSNPMDLSLAPSRPRPAARGSVASRAIDLSPPSERSGPLQSDPYAQIRAANASADWNRGLLQYWLQHRYYPEQAAANGDQGDVTLQLTVNRSGRVEKVEILSHSGSQWLDMAAVSTWRDAKLPPFTNEMREDRITFPVPIHYYLTVR